jgi:hypothetical protein
MRIPTLLLLPTIAACTWAGPVAAQQAAPPTCTAPEHRQFDFWVGEWEVVDTAGTVLGRNHIVSKLNGCVVHEHWTGARGSNGESFNLYRRDTGRWHQTWVDSSGSLLQLDGGMEGSDMVLRGETRAPDGTARQQRITYSPLEGGRVLQLWETSADGGATWAQTFRGIYRRTGG